MNSQQTRRSRTRSQIVLAMFLLTVWLPLAQLTYSQTPATVTKWKCTGTMNGGGSEHAWDKVFGFSMPRGSLSPRPTSYD
jgi:hypothetical protein